ncbi:MAG: CPBP family intramembrane glutamic endopeptidase [Bacteroidia bacterium]|nr:CPBP family intramembrane glutamic endopeptidase [Bacteroidia bacterium]
MKDVKLLPLIATVFLISWIGVIPSLMQAHGYEVGTFLRLLDKLMILGPLLGASLVVFYNQGKAGVSSLFRRLLIFKANQIPILIAVLSPILFAYGGSYLGHVFSKTAWPVSYDFLSILSNGLIIMLGYLIVNTEEIAWRGVVFDKLLDKYGFFKACLILAPIWWLFHMPLFLFPGGHPAGYGLDIFTLIVLGQTFILGWIYIKTKRSLVYVHLHHQLNNGFAEAFPIFPIFIGGNMLPVWMFSGMILLFASLLIFWDRKSLK